MQQQIPMFYGMFYYPIRAGKLRTYPLLPSFMGSVEHSLSIPFRYPRLIVIASAITNKKGVQQWKISTGDSFLSREH